MALRTVAVRHEKGQPWKLLESVSSSPCLGLLHSLSAQHASELGATKLLGRRQRLSRGPTEASGWTDLALWPILGLSPSSTLPWLPPTCSHLPKLLFLSPSSLLLKLSPLSSPWRPREMPLWPGDTQAYSVSKGSLDGPLSYAPQR